MFSIRNLSVHFKTQEGLIKAVDDVSFEIGKGETVGIVGESGSGKSVTALSIMKLVDKPGFLAGGEILFSKQEGEAPIRLSALSESEIRQHRGKDIAMIFQEPMTSLNPVFKCGEQVAEAIRLHLKLPQEAAKHRVLALFERVQLPTPERIYNAYPHQLSGGQKQRVMIAMAMSCNPSLLIADEPTTALDVTVQKAILELMRDLRKDLGASVLFISHDLGVISEIADRVVVMFRGKVVEQGPVDAIFKNPQHPYTKSLLACRPTMDKRLKRLPVVADFMDISAGENGSIQITEKAPGPLRDDHVFIKNEKEIGERLLQLEALPPLLQVNDLKVWYPSKKSFLGKVVEHVKAVDGVSFEVRPGETLGLVGESGCGKTTLGRAVLKLLEATSGTVSFDGKNLMELPEAAMRSLRREMQIIFQDPYSSLNPRMTVGEALMEPLQVHQIGANKEERKEMVLGLLKTVSLEEKHFMRYPHEFSGGQRQRVVIARALSLRPRFIVCDESVSALDVSVQAQVLNLLADLREQFGLTYIFISHDFSVVKFLSDRIAVMNRGKIEEMGPAEQICKDPQREYTQKLIAAIPGRISNK